MLFVGLPFVAVQCLFPKVCRHRIFVPGVVPHRAFGLVNIGADCTLRGTQLLRNSLLHAFLLGRKLRISAQQNVGAATGHIGRDGDHVFAPGLGDDLGFFFVLLGVQDVMLDSLLLQQIGEPLRFFD